MKISHLLRPLITLVALSAAALSSPQLFAREAQPAKLAPVLQPFVESHILAGAVVLVADADKILNVEALGWADIAAKKPTQT